jgi:hypothetical protein
VFEALANKIGVVLLILGVMHFLNLVVFTKLRNRALSPTPAPSTQKPPALPCA